MTALHVLVIDDDPALLPALPETLRLRMSGVTVDTADSAAAALDRIAVRDYDAIVTDIKMPGMDGLALLAEIRGRRPDTPTLMITGHGEYELAVRALRGGAYDFIQKPIDRDRFVAALSRAIRAHALNRQVKDRRLALERCTIKLEKIAEELGREEARVLIVDDDPDLLQALPETLRLRMSGVMVDTADSAAAALDWIAARDYDAIVADIKMPGMDGLALLAEIRERRPDTPTLLITGHGEDDPDLLQALPETLRLRMGGVMVDTADSAAAALERITAEDYDAIVTDIKMPGMDGLDLLAEIRTHRPDTPTLMITGHGEHDLVVDALRAGAYDFIQKPIDRDYFVASLRRAIEMRDLSRRVKEQQLALERHLNELEAIVEERTRELRVTNKVIDSPLRFLMGPNGQMEKIVEQIKQVADSPLTVLVEGETGTGKELVARAIHHLSARREKPFVAVDCGAIPDTLIESELFGYEKGAFTGAHQRKEGQFQLAEGGSLFLDEIVNLPLPTQAKLLRALQERQVQPLGSTRPVRVAARIIAASNVRLDREVRAGRFRQDVYFRLNEFGISLPPLRERDDILHLANEFLPERSEERRVGKAC